MTARIHTLALDGSTPRSVIVACELAPGMSRLVIGGLPDQVSEESRRHVQSAIEAMALALPHKRITVSLTPVCATGNPSLYDLPISLALLAAMGLFDSDRLSDWIALGALDPNGRILPSLEFERAALAARAAGKGLICGKGPAVETDGLPLLTATNLRSLSSELKRLAGGTKAEGGKLSGTGNAKPARRSKAAVNTNITIASGEPKATRPSLWKRLTSLFDRTGSTDEKRDVRTAEIGATDLQLLKAREPELSVVREEQAPFDYTSDNNLPYREAGALDGNDSREFLDLRTDQDTATRRTQLHAKLVEGEPDTLSDQEVLEFILFGARRPGDTSPLAIKLLQRFGSLSGVLQADPTALRTVNGVGDQTIGVIKINAVAARRMARQQVQAKPLLSNWDALIEYLSLDMMHLTRERVRVLYLDKRQQLVKDEHLSEGTLDEASVHPREVIHHALDCGATSLILVHNHPSGSPEPSRADIQLTHRVAAAGKPVEVYVQDHVIVGQGAYVSLRERGLI